MKASYKRDGTVTLSMTRAEAHVMIWGGKVDLVEAVGWNARHALVAGEDTIAEPDYAAMMREVDVLAPDLRPDPVEASA